MVKDISVRFLRVSVGLFFVILGVIGIIPHMQESVFSLNDQRYAVEVIFGIVEMLCGIILIAGLFTFIQRKTLRLASLIILVIWGVRIILTRFVWGIRFTSGIFFLPNIPTWLLVTACEIVILSALFILYRAYE